MNIKKTVALLLSISLVLFPGVALTKGKSDNGAANSGLSLNGDNNGKGLGHCKSPNNGKGHSKKIGKGHDRDCNDGPTCEPSEIDVIFETILDPNDEEQEITIGISFMGELCDNNPDTISFYEGDMDADNGSRVCTLSSGGVGEFTLSPDGLEFYYPLNSIFTCGDADEPA